MPGISSRIGQGRHATVEIEPYHGYREGRLNPLVTRKAQPILRSPVRSLLSSLIRQPRRKKMATRVQHLQEDLNVSGVDFGSAFEMATEWAEVVFFHQGFSTSSVLSIQGWRENTVGVSITPDWQPPSPVLSTGTTSRNPKTLLKSRLVQVPLYCNSHGGGASEEDEEEDDDDDDDNDNDDESFQTSWAPPPPAPAPAPAPKPLPLFTPSSPLSVCNIKHLLSSEKFQQLPKSVQAKLISYLPSSDIHHLSQNPSNGLDSVLNNEYISAALREWQDRLALGTLHRKRSRTQCDLTPSWKERFYEEYWGEMKKRGKPSDKDQSLFYPSNSLTPQQTLVHDSIFSPPTTTPTPTPAPAPLPMTTPSLPPPKPTAPLPVQLPLKAYTVHCSSQQILQEHSYCNTSPSTMKSKLTLIIGSNCNCRQGPLLVCHKCHHLYHSTCASQALCPACSKR